MGLFSWLFGEPRPQPRRKRPNKRELAEKRREKMEQAAREQAERERTVFDQMDRSYSAGYLINPFAVPDDEKLPIGDAAHVRNAVSRFGQTHFRSLSQARAAAHAILDAAVKHDVPVGRDTILAEFTGVYAERVRRSR